MDWLRELPRRLNMLLHRRQFDADLDEEMRLHLELRQEEQLHSGLTADDARAAARQQFGNTTYLKEDSHIAWGWEWFENLVQDVRYGLRTLRKSPGFAALAMLTLALGIGANSALFSVVNGVLLSSLPYPEAERLVAAYTKTRLTDSGAVTYLNFLDWQKDNQSFADLGIFRTENYLLTGVGESERLSGYQISAGFFPTLGVQPVLGRLIFPEEDQIGGTPVALIGEGLWKRKYGSTPDVIGKTLALNGKPYEIVGVIPASFTLRGQARDVYVPIGQWADPTFRNRGINFGTYTIGRLKPGVTLGQAQADMQHVAANLAATYPAVNKDRSVNLVPLKEDLVGKIAPLLFVLLGAVGFVLLIACANVGNLLLARATGRTREFAIRAAIGARRGRLIRQLLTESVLLASAGGALGLAVAQWGTTAILKTLPQTLPRAEAVKVDARVLLFTLAISLLVGTLFGLVPALRMSRTSVQETLKEGGRGMSGARHRAQGALVALEMAMALVLLAGAGLMVRSLSALWSVSPGFDAHNVLTFSMSFPIGIENNPIAQRTTIRKIHDALLAIPGVEYASEQGTSLPTQGRDSLPFWIEGRPKPSAKNDMPQAVFYLTGPEYLKAMGTPLLRGRLPTDQDNEHSQPVALIDETFARKQFPDQDPLGRRINFTEVDMQVEVVGVAAHVKHYGLDSDATARIQEQVYITILQVPDRLMPLLSQGMTYVVKTRLPTGEVVEPIRRAMAAMNPDQVLWGVESMEEILADSLAPRRFTMILLGVFAALALVLASVGIYGVISNIVGQRTQEIGIRVALGARRGDVLKLVIAQGGAMVLVGVGIGLAGAFLLMRFLKQMIFGVSATDPLTLGGVAVLLTTVALLACYIPARRAMQVDPIVALRYE
jgi:predicted permease